MRAKNELIPGVDAPLLALMDAQERSVKDLGTLSASARLARETVERVEGQYETALVAVDALVRAIIAADTDPLTLGDHNRRCVARAIGAVMDDQRHDRERGTYDPSHLDPAMVAMAGLASGDTDCWCDRDPSTVSPPAWHAERGMAVVSRRVRPGDHHA